MNKIRKFLPFLALVLGAFTAFAFSPKQNMNLFGEDGGQWYNVTGITPGPSTYTCDELQSEECLFDSVDGNPVSPGEDRVFVKRGNLPIAH